MGRFDPILVGTDFSRAGDAAAFAAVAIAQRTGASLDLFHAIDRPRAESLAPRLRARLAKRADLSGVRLHVEHAEPGELLRDLRAKLDPGLVVIGESGRHAARRLLLGGLAERALHTPGCPLLVVRDAPRGGLFRRLLVGVEDPDRESPALETALDLAHQIRGELTVLHVLPPKGYVSDSRRIELRPETVNARLERLTAGLDPTIPFAVEVCHGDPVDAIPRLAQKLGSDLVVVGAERGVRGSPGPVAESVARSAPPAALFVWPAGS